MKDQSRSLSRKQIAASNNWRGSARLVVPTLWLATTVLAQEEGTSQDFFGKDFANSMLDGVEVENAKGVKRERPVERQPREPAVRLPGIHGMQPQQAGQQRELQQRERPVAPWASQPFPGGDQNRRSASSEERPREPTARSVLAVDLYVNSLNRAHFEKQMENLAQFVRAGRVQWVYVGHVGDERNVSEKWKKWIESINGTISALPEPPSELKVTQSPTWVMKTKQDQFVFEGFEKVSSLLSKDGDLVLPEEKTSDEPVEDENNVKEPEVAQEF